VKYYVRRCRTIRQLTAFYIMHIRLLITRRTCGLGFPTEPFFSLPKTAIVDIRLRPRCCPLVNHFEYTPYWRGLCMVDYGQTRSYSQNRKYIAYIALSSEEERVKEHVQKISRSLDMRFLRHARGQIYRQTDIQTYIQTNRHTHHNTSHPYTGWEK